jgi:hypothetical protein
MKKTLNFNTDKKLIFYELLLLKKKKKKKKKLNTLKKVKTQEIFINKNVI